MDGLEFNSLLNSCTTTVVKKGNEKKIMKEKDLTCVGYFTTEVMSYDIFRDNNSGEHYIMRN